MSGAWDNRAAPTQSTSPNSVNIFARVIATASAKGRRRLRNSACTLTDGDDLARAFDVAQTPPVGPAGATGCAEGEAVQCPSPANDDIPTSPAAEPFGLLHHLAPLHKAALSRRAMRAAGLDGAATLDELGAAFVLAPERPEERPLRRTFNGQEWVVDLLDLPPPGIDIAAAQAGFDHLTPLRPAAVWLKALADAADAHPHAKDSRLAAMPEDDLAKEAEEQAERWRDIMATRRMRAPAPMTPRSSSMSISFAARE